MPEHHALYRKGMAQIMNPWITMATTVNPPQLIAQLHEHAMNLAVTQGLPQEFAASPNKEGRLIGGAHLLTAQFAVVGKGKHGAGMQGQQTRLAKLGLSNCQSATRQINISIQQGKCL